MDSKYDEMIDKESYLASIDFLKLGLKACFVLNGGAIIALLTYIGNSHADIHPLIDAAKQALPDFIYGVTASAFGLLSAYSGHNARHVINLRKAKKLKPDGSDRMLGNIEMIFRLLTVFVSAGALILFLEGSSLALVIFK